ncbi:MAG TPA: ammonium transporter, partial [Methanophagales archaeon]|nr:ammonium transporter [Methanophagales archaeon]
MEIGKREISVRRLAMGLVMLSMIIALIPAVMAGDPTGGSTLEEDPGAPVDYVWIL